MIACHHLTEGLNLTDKEARCVVELIRPCFNEYVSKYDERKYPSDVYKKVLRAFGTSDKVTDVDIRTVIRRKFGHLAKERIPSHHEALITCIQKRWPDLWPDVLDSTLDVFDRLAAGVGGPHRYITVSFLLHLLRPSEVPIIDQFNSRAMLLRRSASGMAVEAQALDRPSTYGDLDTLSRFLNAIRRGWKSVDPSNVPSQRSLGPTFAKVSLFSAFHRPRSGFRAF